MAIQYPPLTTTFTPPTSCASEWTIYTSSPLTIVDFLSYGGIYPVLTCYPPGMATQNGVFSPGLICPFGYTTVPNQLTTFGPAFTTVACCSSGFDWQTEWGVCTKTFSSTTIFSVNNFGTTSSDIDLGPGQAWRDPIYLIWAASDLPGYSTTNSYSSTSAATSSSSTPSTVPTSSNIIGLPSNTSNATPSSTAHPSLSAGVIAGIAAGVIFACVLLAGLLLILRHRRKNLRVNTTEENMVVPELHDESKAPYPELPVTEVHQLPAALGAELDNSNRHYNGDVRWNNVNGNNAVLEPRHELLGASPFAPPPGLQELPTSTANSMPAPQAVLYELPHGQEHPPQELPSVGLYIDSASPSKPEELKNTKNHSPTHSQTNAASEPAELASPNTETHAEGANPIKDVSGDILRDVELRWLEEEEARIRKRRAALLGKD